MRSLAHILSSNPINDNDGIEDDILYWNYVCYNYNYETLKLEGVQIVLEKHKLRGIF